MLEEVLQKLLDSAIYVQIDTSSDGGFDVYLGEDYMYAKNFPGPVIDFDAIARWLDEGARKNYPRFVAEPRLG